MGKRSGALDTLRGLAIILVVAQHWLALPFGWTGVDLFFVLSGYLIGGILIDNRESPNYFSAFYMRRAFRILPLYWLLLAVSFSPAFGCQFRWHYLAFLQNLDWSAAGKGDCAPASITWSLALEEQFYLLLPVMIRFTPPIVLPRLCLCMIAMAPLCRMGIVLFYGNLISAFVLLPGRMDSLFIGTLIAWVVRQDVLMDTLRRRVPMLWALSALSAAGFITIGLNGGFHWDATFLMWTAGYSLIAATYGFALLGMVVGRWEPSPEFPLCFVGVGAYSIYLFHILVPDIVDSLFGVPAIANVLICCVVIAGVSAACWLLLERPAICFARVWWSYSGRSAPQKALAQRARQYAGKILATSNIPHR